MKLASSTDTKFLSRPPFAITQCGGVIPAFAKTPGHRANVSAVTDSLAQPQSVVLESESKPRTQTKNTTISTPNSLLYTREATQLSLEFVAAALARMGLAGLHEAESSVLNVLLGLFLGGHHILVLLLETLDARLEVLLGLGNLGLGFLDKRVEFGSDHAQEFLNIGLLVGVTEINVTWGAHGLELFLGKLFERGIVSATLVVLEIGGISPLEGWLCINNKSWIER